MSKFGMLKPYIFAHRGGMGNCIENTMPCFRKAVEMGIGIETDFQLTKDNELICFHDPFIKIESNWLNVTNLTYHELSEIFGGKRTIPTANVLFSSFQNVNGGLRYSCDIRDKNSGLILINLAEEFKILDRIEITERSLKVLQYLRQFNKKVKLVYTSPENIKKINSNIDFEKLHSLNIGAINVKGWRGNQDNLKSIVDNNLECYVWGVNNRRRMKKVLMLNYKNQCVSAIYTDYPDKLISLKEELQF